MPRSFFDVIDAMRCHTTAHIAVSGSQLPKPFQSCQGDHTSSPQHGCARDGWMSLVVSALRLTGGWAGDRFLDSYSGDWGVEWLK